MACSRYSPAIPSAALALSGALLVAQTAHPAEAENARAGRTYIDVPTFTGEDDQRVLAAFAGLRVADVSDGMDAAGLPDIGLMSPDIRPLWKDPETYAHRFVGIAVTARYIPTQLPPAGKMEPDAFDRWVGAWYGQRSPEPFVPLLREGSALVIEEAPDTDVGSIGSNNIMSWKLRGCVGVVTSATARDTDEIITERIPLYFKHPGRGIRPGRNEIESVNRPVVCGGVTVMPGDVIVADGDGVIVVPRAKAEEVAKVARAILEQDKAGRRNLYRQLGLPNDASVE
jgi:regulator of RNase E activity RraA